MKRYQVKHDVGIMIVEAENPQDAREQYYKSLEGILGHQLKICGCFGEKKPIDRSKISGIISIDEICHDLGVGDE